MGQKHASNNVDILLTSYIEMKFKEKLIIYMMLGIRAFKFLPLLWKIKQTQK